MSEDQIFYVPIRVETVVAVHGAVSKEDAANKVAVALKKPIKYNGWALPDPGEDMSTSEHGYIVGPVEYSCISEKEWMKLSNKKRDKWW
jgi:hypothetical protein